MTANFERKRWRHRFALAGLALGVAAAVAGTLVPQPIIAWAIHHVPGFKAPWHFLHASLPGFNPIHAVVYAGIVVLWHLAAPRVPQWLPSAVLVVLGAVLEYLQFFTIGRTPRLSDLVSDLVGIAIGWLIARALGKRPERM